MTAKKPSMKTYLNVWFNSDGERATEVTSRLMSMGFRPVHGRYDYVYEWNGNTTLDDTIAFGDSVTATLKGCNVYFTLETEQC